MSTHMLVALLSEMIIISVAASRTRHLDAERQLAQHA